MRLSILLWPFFCIFANNIIRPCSGIPGGSSVSTSTNPNIKARRVLVVAGNFSIDGELVNIAQYDIATKEWSPKYVSELYLYGESNGIIWDIVVNKTSQPFNKLFVVGAFDTVSETSQIQFCSVGEWDGLSFDKVGEGLCPRGGDSSTAMSIQTAALGNDGDIFVGGSFESRVWDGHHFVNVYHVAHFDGRKSSWLPLVGSQLSSDNSQIMPRVNTLSWDAEGSVLYMGGSFYAIESNEITPGLAMWTEQTGLQPFPGGGLFRDALGVSGVALRIAYESTSNALFVAGLFHMVDDLPCQNIAVWIKRTNEWICLYQSSKAFSTVTSMLVHNDKVYVTGWAAADSDWSGRTWGSPYAIAVLDIGGFIQENQSGGSGSNGSGNSSGGNQNNSSSSTAYPTGPPTPLNTSPSNNNNNSSSGNSGSADPDNHRNIFDEFMRRKRKTLDSHSHRKSHISSRKKSHIRHSLDDLQSDAHNTATSIGELLKLLHASESTGEWKLPQYLRVRNVSHSAERRRLRHERRKLSAKTQKVNLDYTTHSPTHSPSYSLLSNASNNSSSNSSLLTPTAAPIQIPWSPRWSWLPGYSGGNGPVLRMAGGSESFEGCLFLVGAFNNYPAIALWYDDPLSGPYTVALPSKHSVQGFITAIAQVNLPFEDVPIPTPPPNSFHQKDYTLLILLSCVMIGVFLGVVFAICCNSQGYTKVDSDDSNGELMMGIPLKTLSGGANYSVDFRECFERAMKARHLPTHESLLIINPKEIVLSKIIGEGSFGRVWNGQWRNNSVAVKEFVFAQAAIVGGSLERNNIIEEIVGEAGVMACLRHPKILQLYGCSLTMQAIWIVSEFCSRGSLRMLLNDKTLDLPFLKKVSICLDVADGMLYLHTRSPPIIHRDIKSHNIFITEPSPGHFVAKIGDWGSARAVALTGAKSMTQGVGTACWLAPEVINYAHASKDSDVYAFGIVLWEVFTRHEVYEGLSAAQIIAKVANEGLRPRVPRDCPWASIMTECWQQDASQRPGFHRVMTSLSKIYSRAKAANKGKSGVSTSTSTSSAIGLSASASSASADTMGLTPPTAVAVTAVKGNMRTGPSIFQPTPSENAAGTQGGSLSAALASFTGKNRDSSGSKNTGVAGIYFGNRNPVIDQYLTVKPKIPSRVSSDPIRVYKQSDATGAGEEQKGKTWSNDVLPKALKSWPSGSDKSTAAGPGPSPIESEKSVRLYDFSSTPTGVSSSGDSMGKKSPPNNFRHFSGSESSPPGSGVGVPVGPIRAILPAPGGRKGSGSSTPSSGGGPAPGLGPRCTAAGQIDDNQEADKPPLTNGMFKAVVDLGEGRSSPVEYVVIDSMPSDQSRERNDPSRRRNCSEELRPAKFQEFSLDDSMNGTPESNDDEDELEGYSSVDKYNSMRVGRTASVTSDAMNISGKNSFSFAYESTRSESPPCNNGNINLFPSQQVTYTSLSSGDVSGGSSSNSTGPAKSVTGNAVKFSNVPVNPLEERNLFLRLPRPIVPTSPARVVAAQSPDLLATGDSAAAVGGLLVAPFYRSNASRSRSRSGGRWRPDSSLVIANRSDRDVAVAMQGDEEGGRDREREEGEEDGMLDGIVDGDDELAGGYDTT